VTACGARSILPNATFPLLPSLSDYGDEEATFAARPHHCFGAGRARLALVQCEQRMADWKQIQARIRRAKASSDARGKLAELYEKTRDAMVAFELARHLEQAGEVADAGRWYASAAQGFRRPQWKAKAEEALGRLGTPPNTEPPMALAGEAAPPLEPAAVPAQENSAHDEEPTVAPPPAAVQAGAIQEGRKRRRRGVRGGRRHRRGRGKRDAAIASTAKAEALPAAARQGEGAPPSAVEFAWRQSPLETTSVVPQEAPSREEEEVPRRVAGPRGRAGDPGLSSRIAFLESQLRRLLVAPPARPDQADRAPAGPGVFLLADSDQLTNYYVEACQTLRIGVGNLLKERRHAPGRPAGGSLRARLAKHLGISEARASKYLADQCMIRWLQLDEETDYLANFAIAVLRPVLNRE